MSNIEQYKQALFNNGYAIVPTIYTQEEVQALLTIINNANVHRDRFRKSNDLFAIRQFLREIPETIALVFNDRLKRLVEQMLGVGYFVVKSIYFDKPESSNWYVAYHQDLTISVDRKMELAGFTAWTSKQNQFAVQPPIEFLETGVTIRIHLDDTDEQNGALRVIPQSHVKQIYRAANINWEKEEEAICAVPKGGVMLMKPLLLHSSGRTTNQHQRRVIHIELSNKALPHGLEWSEYLPID
jgi:ectoine hydroxylase-related dioxygenase (phytanoyl-CoA dioxygenase family)